FLFVGPRVLPFDVPIGRVRLNAFGRNVYLGRTVNALMSATSDLTEEIRNGSMRAFGQPASDRRGADLVSEGWMEVVVKIDRTTKSRSNAEPTEPIEPPNRNQ